MSTLSLESALRTCKVNTDWANRMESSRFIGQASEKMCPMWNGFDSFGRPVCPDSFKNKSAGCNSAEDRIVVENHVSRPQYIPYINLNIDGVTGDYMYNEDIKMTHEKDKFFYEQRHVGGNGFGTQMSSFINQGGACNYRSHIAEESEEQNAQRDCHHRQIMANGSQYRVLGGFF